MASNETIKNLSTLLGALRDFNEPRREIESYAKKALIDFNMQKKLLDLELEKTKEDEEILGLAMSAERARNQQFGIIPSTEDVEEQVKMLEDKSADKMGIGDVITSSLRGPGLLGNPILGKIRKKSRQQKTLMDAIDLLETNVYKGTLDEDTGVPSISGTFTEAAQLAKGEMKTDLLTEADEYKSQIQRIYNSSEFQGESLLDEATKDRLATVEDLLNESINVLRK